MTMETQTNTGELISGDAPLIAEKLDVSKVYVSDLVAGRAGKRQTLQQMKVMKAVEFCKQKNAEKIAFCEQLAGSDDITINPVQ